MPNQRSLTNKRRTITVEDELWEAARVACEELGTTRGQVVRDALAEVVRCPSPTRQRADESRG